MEKHHIIPKCLHGTDESENIVILTPKEHFVCHRLLVKMTTGSAKQKMSFAINMMQRKNQNQPHRYVCSSRTYAHIKEQFSQSMKEMWNNPNFKRKMSEKAKTRWKDKEYKDYMIEKIKEKWQNAEYKHYMKETMKKYWAVPKNREAQSLRQIEINKSPLVRNKKAQWGESNGMYGKTHTTEAKAIFSENATKTFKNKSYEELYGRGKANELKELRSTTQKKWTSKNPCFGKNNANAKRVHIKGRNFDFIKEAAAFYDKLPDTISTWVKTRDDCWYL